MNWQQYERDLNFHPVVNDAPKHLSLEQVKQYNDLGYVKDLTIYDAAQAQEIRKYFDDMMSQVEKLGGNRYTINGYHNRCQGLYDIALNPLILDYVEDLLGPNFIAWGTHFFNKVAHDPKAVPWHQDASYWPLTPSKTVTVWLAIDDVDRENSAMQFIAGSHKNGHIQFEEAQGDVVLGQEIADAEKYGHVVDVELKAGQISLHSDMLIHGSVPNPSDRRRCGLTIRYASTDVKPLTESWGKQTILCKGSDEFGHWGAMIERPDGENYSLPDWEKSTK